MGINIRNLAVNYLVSNPIIPQGEFALETNTNKVKLGDGITPWNNLSYFGINNGSTTELTQIIVDTTGERQVVQHNLNKRPQIVTFFDGDTQVFFEYYRGDGEPDSDPLNNIILYTDKIYTNLEINIV